jgi:hypothetical protein
VGVISCRDAANVSGTSHCVPMMSGCTTAETRLRSPLVTEPVGLASLNSLFDLGGGSPTQDRFDGVKTVDCSLGTKMKNQSHSYFEVHLK